ncbi:MAG: hypothetical protein K0B85_06555 [Coriobacteriia bacterium]|nr:hypothetical protein [Coriobacteriia bacterium]
MLLSLVTGITYFTLAVTALATSVGVFIAPIAQLVLGEPVFRTLEYGYLIEPWAMPLVMAAGATSRCRSTVPSARTCGLRWARASSPSREGPTLTY